MQPISIGQSEYDLLELFLAGRTKVNGHAKTIYQRKLFLYSIIGMQIVIPVGFIAEFLTNQMTAVGSGVDQNIVWFPFQSPFNNRFQIFILNFKIWSIWPTPW